MSHPTVLWDVREEEGRKDEHRPCLGQEAFTSPNPPDPFPLSLTDHVIRQLGSPPPIQALSQRGAFGADPEFPGSYSCDGCVCSRQAGAGQEEQPTVTATLAGHLVCGHPGAHGGA